MGMTDLSIEQLWRATDRLADHYAPAYAVSRALEAWAGWAPVDDHSLRTAAKTLANIEASLHRHQLHPDVAMYIAMPSIRLIAGARGIKCHA